MTYPSLFGSSRYPLIWLPFYCLLFLISVFVSHFNSSFLVIFRKEHHLVILAVDHTDGFIAVAFTRNAHYFLRLLLAMENFLTYFCSLQLELLGIVQCIPILHLLVDRGPQKELCFNYWYGIIYTSGNIAVIF